MAKEFGRRGGYRTPRRPLKRAPIPMREREEESINFEDIADKVMDIVERGSITDVEEAVNVLAGLIPFSKWKMAMRALEDI